MTILLTYEKDVQQNCRKIFLQSRWFIKTTPFVGKFTFFLIETVGKVSYKSDCFSFSVTVSWDEFFRANVQFSSKTKWLQRICRKIFLQPHHCNHFFFNCHFKTFVVVIFSLWFSYITTFHKSKSFSKIL